MRDGRLTETCLDGAATLWIAGCTAYAAGIATNSAGPGYSLALSLGCAGAAGLITFRLLQCLQRPQATLPLFDVVPLEPNAGNRDAELLGELLLNSDMAVLPTELLLTEGQMLSRGAAPASCGELLLDDVLVELQPGARVVQLFDPSRVPTPGELKSRIDAHLRRGRSNEPQHTPDASQALYDALADLRRSLG